MTGFRHSVVGVMLPASGVTLLALARAAFRKNIAAKKKNGLLVLSVIRGIPTMKYM